MEEAKEINIKLDKIDIICKGFKIERHSLSTHYKNISLTKTSVDTVIEELNIIYKKLD